jgi:hypothetical protein
MKVHLIESEVWWIGLLDEIRPTHGLDTGAAFAALQQAFGFPVIPIGPVKQGGGIEFTHGALREGAEPILVTKMVIYSDGVSIQVPTDTGKAEIALQKTLAIFSSFGVREPITPPLHYYRSMLVADFSTSLNHLFPSSLLEKIAGAFSFEAKAEFSRIDFNADKTTLSYRARSINPTNFSIERRTDVPYDQNRYFSQANMTTEKHIEFLEQFERLAAKMNEAAN